MKARARKFEEENEESLLQRLAVAEADNKRLAVAQADNKEEARVKGLLAGAAQRGDAWARRGDPVSTGRRTRRVQLVRGEGRDVSS